MSPDPALGPLRFASTVGTVTSGSMTGAATSTTVSNGVASTDTPTLSTPIPSPYYGELCCSLQNEWFACARRVQFTRLLLQCFQVPCVQTLRYRCTPLLDLVILTTDDLVVLFDALLAFPG